MNPTIVFAHANGFPAGTYRKLFDIWGNVGWRVCAVPMFGHDPRYPVTSGWRRLRDQLVDFIVDETPAGAFLVGHSLGGILAVMVACRRPDLVRGVVLLDSPLFAGWRAQSLRMLKVTGLMGRVSPGRIARKRRDEWPSRADALAHFARKSKFARWAPGVLQDYIAACTELHDGRAVLAYDRVVEARIYDSLPHDLGAILRKHPPRCPVAFVGGERSREVRQGGLATTRALVGSRIRWIAGTHLFPMEQPALAAAVVLELLATMSG